MKLIVLFFLPLVWLFVNVPCLTAYTSPGSPQGYVSDFAGILSAQTKQQLESDLASLEASTSAQVAVVTINDLGNETIETYAVKLFEDWGIGQKGKDNGVLFLTAVNDRAVRIEVGYGLEGVLTDANSSYIIRNVVLPAYRNNQYEQGIMLGTQAIRMVVAGDTTYSPPQEKEEEDSFFGLLMMGFFGLQFLTALLSRTKSWWLGGVLGGILGLLVSLLQGFWWAGIIALAVFVPLGLLVDFIVSQQRSHQDNYPWWIGRSSGGWGGGSSGGGFGGFGGGRSGGGGSSGSW